MFKAFVVIAAVAASLVAAKSDHKVSVKGYTASIDADESKCKIGSGEIGKACGKCASSITECATAGVIDKVKICLDDISSFAEDCGGCAVDLLECL